MDVDRCICCGEVIPEGRQICWSCEHSVNNNSNNDKNLNKDKEN